MRDVPFFHGDSQTKNSLAALIAATTGIGKITASELLAAAGIDSNTTALTAEDEQRLANAIYSLQQSANQQTSAPVYAVISRTNHPHPFPLNDTLGP